MFGAQSEELRVFSASSPQSDGSEVQEDEAAERLSLVWSTMLTVRPS